MATANEALFDQSVRHAIYVHRYGGGLARRILELLNKADADLIMQIAERLERIEQRGTDQGPATTARLESLLDAIRLTTQETYRNLYNEASGELTDFGKTEADFAARQVQDAIYDAGVDLGLLKPSPALLRAIVTKRPFQGRHLRDWVKDLAAGKLKRLADAINIGLIEGQTNDQIIRRIRGSRALNYRDGILEVTRRHAEGIVRTATNHVSNAARQSLYEANADLVKGVRWVSTLDSRTTPICRARDGKVYPLDSGPRPPAHPRCRSSMVSVLKSWEEIAAPGSLARGRGSTSFDKLFDEALAEQGFDAEARAQIKANTRASMNGQVPGDLTYNGWLKKQSAGVQDDILGKSKGALFRRGGLEVDQFVDRAGQEYTLAELKAKYASAFERAGI